MKYFTLITVLFTTLCTQAQSASDLIKWFEGNRVWASGQSNTISILNPAYNISISNKGVTIDNESTETEIKWADLRSISTDGDEDKQSKYSSEVVDVFLVSDKWGEDSRVFIKIEVFQDDCKEYLAKLRQLAKLKGSRLVAEEITGESMEQTIEWLNLRGTVDIDDGYNNIRIACTPQYVKSFEFEKNYSTNKYEEKNVVQTLWKDIKYIWLDSNYNVNLYTVNKDKDGNNIVVQFEGEYNNFMKFIAALKHAAKLGGAKVLNDNINTLTEAELLEVLHFFEKDVSHNAESISTTASGLNARNLLFYENEEKKNAESYVLAWNAIKNIETFEVYNEYTFSVAKITAGNAKYIAYYTTASDIVQIYYDTLKRMASLKGARLN